VGDGAGGASSPCAVFAKKSQAMRTAGAKCSSRIARGGRNDASPFAVSVMKA
jgi:hypothetical protein